MLINKHIIKIKSELYKSKIYVAGIPVVEIYNCPKSCYNKQKIKIFGIKFPYNSRNRLKKIVEKNIELNKQNLDVKLPENKNTILYIAADFIRSGGVETRIGQYAEKLADEGWNVCFLSEYNENERLLKFTNFYLNFEADNFNDCLNELVDKYNIDIIEFQFKNTKILNKINLLQLKNKVKIGCTIHNLGVRNKKIINNFDYKIFISKYMYDNFYKDIKNGCVIQNSIDTANHEAFPIWQYKNQTTALLVTRISADKINSIECFIKYCKRNNIDFKIAGEENHTDFLTKKLIKKFNLQQNKFIGRINTLDYLKSHCDDILFVGGVGLVILESLYLGYPSFCCSDSKNESYSFVTDSNIHLFDNFTIRKESLISKLKKKEHCLVIDNISGYCLSDYILKKRNLNTNFQDYLNILSESKHME